MATVTINSFTITKDTANADLDLDFTINWDAFDQLTNLKYRVTYRLIGDDTGQDQDDGSVGDDLVGLEYFFVSDQSSNGAASRDYNPQWTVAWSTLDEDGGASSSLNDDEIRAKVTIEPRIPTSLTEESSRVVVSAP